MQKGRSRGTMQCLWSVIIFAICLLAARAGADAVPGHNSLGSISEAYVVDHSSSDPYGAERAIWNGVERVGRGVVELAKKAAPGIRRRASTITQWAETHVTRVEELMDRGKEQKETVGGIRGVWGAPRGVMRKDPVEHAPAAVDGDNSDWSVEGGQQSVRSDTLSSTSATTTTAAAATTSTTTGTDWDVAINNVDSHATTSDSELSIINDTKDHVIMANVMIAAAPEAHVTAAVDLTATDVSLAHGAESTGAGGDRVPACGISHVIISVRAVNNGGTRVAAPVEAFTTEGSHYQALDRAMTGSDEDEDNLDGAVFTITSALNPCKQPPAALTGANMCTSTAVGGIFSHADDRLTFTASHHFASDRPVRILLSSAGGRAPRACLESAVLKTSLGTTSYELWLRHLMETHPPLLTDLTFASNAMDAAAGSPPVKVATTTTPSTTAAPTASYDAVCVIDEGGQEHIDDVRHAADKSSGGDTTRTKSTLSTAQGSGKALPATTPSTDAHQVWGTPIEGSKLTIRERMARHDLIFMPDTACPQGYLCLRPKSMPDAQDISPSDYLLFMLLDAGADNVGTPSPTKTTATITAAAITDRCAAMLMVARGLSWADIVAQVGAALRDLVRLISVTFNVTVSRSFGRHTGVGDACTASAMVTFHQYPTPASAPSTGLGSSTRTPPTGTAASATNSPVSVCRPPSTPRHNVTPTAGSPTCARESVNDAAVSSSSAAAVPAAPRDPVGGASMTHTHTSAHTPIPTSAGSLGSRDTSVYTTVGLTALRARSSIINNSTHSRRGPSVVVKFGALVAAWCIAGGVIALLLVNRKWSHRRRRTHDSRVSMEDRDEVTERGSDSESKWKFWAGWGEFVEEWFALEGLLGCNDEEVEEWVVSEEERYRSYVSAASNLSFVDMWYIATGEAWEGEDYVIDVSVGEFFRRYRTMVEIIKSRAREEILREVLGQVDVLKCATYEWGEEGCAVLEDMLDREEREAARSGHGGVCGEAGEGMELGTVEEEAGKSEREEGQEAESEEAREGIISDGYEEKGPKQGDGEVQQVVGAAGEAPVSGVSNGHAVLAALVKGAWRIKAQREGRMEVEEDEEEEREEW